jgi:hypothetical protein
MVFRDFTLYRTIFYNMSYNILHYICDYKIKNLNFKTPFLFSQPAGRQAPRGKG